MNDEYLLVDGYNIIHAWGELKAMANDDLEGARQKLIDIISDYQGYKLINITIIFDAYKLKGGTVKKYRYNNIDIVYTKEKETADQFIEKEIYKFSKYDKVRVATSDALEQTIVLGKGATRVSARELWIEINSFKKAQTEKYMEKRPIKNNLLEDNLSLDIKKWMDDFRKQ